MEFIPYLCRRLVDQVINQHRQGQMNIGKHIEEILRKQGRSALQLASQIPCEHTNVYNIFKRKSLDVRLLMRINVILEYDFFMRIIRRRLFKKVNDLERYLIKGDGFYFVE